MNNILVPAQHGFCKGRSTISAITALLNDVYDNQNNTSPAYLVFLDLTKAFDSVSHELLLSKLKETGISIEFCKWMESYLANRVQRVKLNNSALPYTAIKYGVPQGSVLGPILFSIYINNLGLLLDNIQIYADDAVIYSTNLMTLQDNLNAVVAWSNRNLLTLNRKKTKWMIIGKNTRYVGEDNNLYVNGAPLEQVFSFNYLGLIIDTSLDFREHRAKVMKQVQLKLN